LSATDHRKSGNVHVFDLHTSFWEAFGKEKPLCCHDAIAGGIGGGISVDFVIVCEGSNIEVKAP